MPVTRTTFSEKNITLKSIDAKLNRVVDEIFGPKSKLSELKKKQVEQKSYFTYLHKESTGTK